MESITVFSAPKAFTDPHIAVIQRNAIRSWALLPGVEVILIGQEAGMNEVARELGVRHLPDVNRNSSGTPLVSSIFGRARQNSDSPLLAYVNADILLLPDFATTARKVSERLKCFLLVGRRWDLKVSAALDFSPGWQEGLQARIKREGRLHPPAGSDYFIFPRPCFEQIPDFAIGRSGWDNWMIYQARARRWPAVDGSAAITIVHQDHEYGHLPGGKPHYRLPESLENARLAGGRVVTRFNLLDTDRRWVSGRLRRQPFRWSSLRRRIEAFPLLAFGNASFSERLVGWFSRFDPGTGGK